MSQTLHRLFDNHVRVPDFYFDVKTDVIYLVKSIGGKKEKVSSGIKRPFVSRAKREAFKKLKLKESMKKQKSSPLIRDLLEKWILIKESESLAYDTMNNVRRAKKQIEEFWGSKFPSEITRDTVAEWYSWWRAYHPDIEMENAVKYMLNFCNGYLSKTIVDEKPLLLVVPAIADPNYKKIRRARKKKKERVFTGQEFNQIFRTAEIPEHQLVILFMYTMAARITETLELEFDNQIILDREPPVYRWSDGQNKADLDGRHALHPSLIDRFERLRVTRKLQGTKRMFPQKGDNKKALREQMIDWKAWRKRANIGWHWTPHTFRHTCLTNLFSDEKNPQGLICKLYRVSLAVALETYIHPTESSMLKMRNVLEVSI
jgi:integrase